MLSRIKFSIEELVNDILDQLPADVWTSTTTTFCDPSIGGGQFVREIERRLREAGHTDENIKSRVFGFESSALSMGYALNRYGLVGTYEVCNFLEKEFGKMKFDVVVGNPPYQKAPSEKRNTSLGGRGLTDLWPEFVSKGVSLVKDNGYLALIHPISWRKPNDRNGFWKLLTQDNQMEKLVMLSKKKVQSVFGVGTCVDYYIIHKKKQYKSTVVVDHEDVIYDLDLFGFDWLPNYAIDEISEYLGDGTGTKVLYNTFYHSQKDNRDIRDKKYKYPVVHLINGNGLGMRYFDRLQENDTTHFGVPKVLLNQNELQYPYNDYKGEYGMGQLTFGIAISSKKEGDEIVAFLNSAKGKRLIAATKWNTFYTNYEMFRSFKKDWYKCS